MVFMKKLSDIQIKLLDLLSDGCCHSGNALGTTLGVSRTAVWKQIKQLTQNGIAIESLPTQGYRLPTPLILLSEPRVEHNLTRLNFNHPTRLHIFSSINSTNHFLKTLAPSPGLDVCSAETQTEGRGRFGRSWHSPFGENLYCSIRWHFDCDISALSGLSLVVSLAVMDTLNEFGITENIGIKWPNDILWLTKKLCGCLIEINAESNGGAEVVIGIGLNANSATVENPLPDKPWCSLYEITGQYFDRNKLLATLICQLHKHINTFVCKGFPEFMDRWHQVDYLQGKLITVTHPLGTLSGVAKGINEYGQLILLDEEGAVHYLSSGDTSLQSIGS